MRYLGGKSRFAKAIIEAMAVPEDAVYVEPFVGGASVISRVRAKRRIANDVHPNLIALLSAVGAGWEPPTTLTLAEWRDLRAQARAGVVSPLVGFAGFCCSYGARWFEGYARTTRGEDNSPLPAVAARALKQQAPLLEGIEWHTGSYADLDIPRGSVIYCDPPYIGTKGYSGTGPFDPKRLEHWCLTQHLERACTVYMSEQHPYSEAWTELWSQPRTSGLDQDGERKVIIERLFTLD